MNLQRNVFENPQPGDQQTDGDANSCLLCGNGEKAQTLFKLSRQILKCERCGLVYAEKAGPGVLKALYTESYYRQGAYADYLGDRVAIRKNAARVLKHLERLVEGRTLLDVGCAAGFFLDAARAHGWAVKGLEFSEYAADYARRELQLRVDTGSIVDPPKDLPTFDVITMWDTIEHLERPDLALAHIRRLLRPEGVCVLSTGDHASLMRRLTGKNWRLFSDPTHNFFFDHSTMETLLRQAGFRMTSITHQGKWVSLAMILHQSRLPFAARAQDWLSTRNWNPSIYVNLWDVMTVIAKPVA